MLLLLDNYDSFTYNLAQMFATRRIELLVVRNDEVDARGIERLRPRAIVISPGPGRPEDAGVSLDAVDYALENRVPLLGVCLGHQVLAARFGGRVVRHEPVHGKTDLVRHDNEAIFAGMKNPFTATRYHSLVVEPDSLPGELAVSAWTEAGVCMGIRHRAAPLFGVQFHPESFLSEEGDRLVDNFLALVGGEDSERA